MLRFQERTPNSEARATAPLRSKSCHRTRLLNELVCGGTEIDYILCPFSSSLLFLDNNILDVSFTTDI